ncbi:MAG TPA: serine/threonine-protein kinase [Thermoleophilaceae bacterium]
MDRTDQLYGGRYRLIDRLGAGAMAVVHRARDERLRRDVAVKVLAQRFRQDMLAVRRFRREAELGARLWHPNVVAVLDAGAEPDPFIVMELVRGPHAAALAKGRAQQPLAAALRISTQVAAGLQHTHDHGLIHGDVSPGNVLVSEHDGTAKLADFGLASAVEDGAGERLGDLGGTPGYVAPEVLDGAPPSNASDLYSLAAVASLLIEDPPPRVGEVLRRALSSDPAGRQASVAEFRAGLAGHRIAPAWPRAAAA